MIGAISVGMKTLDLPKINLIMWTVPPCVDVNVCLDIDLSLI